MAFWYLASPYSEYPYGISQAHLHVCQEAARLIAAGVPVYSPIAHTHPIAEHGLLDPFDHDIWLPVDEPMMAAAGGLIVLKLTSWTHSFGIRYEEDQFRRTGKPIVYMEPGVVPDELLQEGR